MNLLPLLANFPLCSAFKMLQGKKPLVSNIPSKTQEKRQLFGDLWVSFFCNLKSQTKWKMVTPNENELNDRLDCFSHQWIFIFWHVPFKNVIQLTAGSWSRAPPTFRCIDHALQCHRRPVGWCSDGGGATIPLREFPFEASRRVEVSFSQWGQIGFDFAISAQKAIQFTNASRLKAICCRPRKTYVYGFEFTFMDCIVMDWIDFWMVALP